MSVTPDDLRDAEARLERVAPGYLDKVRRRAAALGVPATPRDRARSAVELTEASGAIDPNVPLLSNRPSGRMVKTAVATATRFYMLHLARQINEFAGSTAGMGQALVDYVAGLEAEVADLRERVRCLEERLGNP